MHLCLNTGYNLTMKPVRKDEELSRPIRIGYKSNINDLGYSKIRGRTMYADHKLAEFKDRKSME